MKATPDDDDDDDGGGEGGDGAAERRAAPERPERGRGGRWDRDPNRYVSRHLGDRMQQIGFRQQDSC